MSAGPGGIGPKNKSNLSVASLINCSSNKVYIGAKGSNEVSGTVVCSCSFDSLTKNVTTVAMLHSLPTVANSELLYKSIVSTLASQNGIPPLAPARISAATPPVNMKHNVKCLDHSDIVFSYSTTTSPIAHIRSLTNSVTSQSPVLALPKQQPATVVHVDPRFASNLKPKLPVNAFSVSKLSSPFLSSNSTTVILPNVGRESAKGCIKMTQPITGVSRKIKNVSGNPTVSNTEDPSNLRNVAEKTSETNVLSAPPIFVPRGWNRILDKGTITYTSPNKSRIRCYEDLITYLTSESTCKCGLDCPFKPSEVFSFDPKIPSKFGFSANTDPSAEITCCVNKKFTELFPPAVKLRDGRGRKPGVKTKRLSEEEIQNPDRKKILLTGASPLEMFQTGMDAINSKSTVTFKTLTNPQSRSLNLKEFHQNANLVTSIDTVTCATTQTDLKTQLLYTKPVTNSCPTTSESPVISNKLEPSSCGYQPSTPTTKNLIVSTKTHAAITNQVVDMPFPKSLMGEKKKRKISTRGRGRGNSGKVTNDIGKRKRIGSEPSSIKTNDLQLAEYFQQAYLNNHKAQTLKAGEVIPSLKTIQSSSILVSNQQIMNSAGLLSAPDSKAAELKDLYKHLQAVIINQQFQNAAAYNNAALLVSSNTPTVCIQPEKGQSSSVPPNRIISSSNKLPEALRNQLSGTLSVGMQSSTPIISTLGSCSLTNMIQTNDCQASTVCFKGKSETDVKYSVTNVSSSKSSKTNSPLNLPVNKPLQNVSLPTTSPSSNQQVHTQSLTAQQHPSQMVLVQLVSQNNTSSKPNAIKVNPPIVHAFPMAHQQAYVHTQGPSKFLFMGNNNCSPPLQTLAIQTAPSNGHIITNDADNSKRTLQIHGVIPPQISPQGSNGSLPIQYLAAVNRPASYPVQYITATKQNPVSYVYPANCSMTVRPTVSSITGNFVRIAPAVQPVGAASNMLEQDKKKKEIEILASMQEHIRSNSVVSQVSPDVVSKASSFLNSVALATSKIATTSLKPNASSNNSTSLHATIAAFKTKGVQNLVTSSSPMTIADYMKAVGMGALPNSTSGSHVFASLLSKDPSDDTRVTENSNVLGIKGEPLSTGALAGTPHTRTCHPTTSGNHSSSPTAAGTVNCQLQQTNNSVVSINMPIQELSKASDGDEMLLHCDEKSTDLLASSDESKSQSPKADVNEPDYPVDGVSSFESSAKNLKKDNQQNSSDTFCEGDLVWVNILGYPEWPGTVTSHLKAQQQRLTKDKVYVRWFGSNQIHAVSNLQCRRFDERTLPAQFRGGDKTPMSDFERAVIEATTELERSKKK